MASLVGFGTLVSERQAGMGLLALENGLIPSMHIKPHGDFIAAMFQKGLSWITFAGEETASTRTIWSRLQGKKIEIGESVHCCLVINKCPKRTARKDMLTYRRTFTRHREELTIVSVANVARIENGLYARAGRLKRIAKMGMSLVQETPIPTSTAGGLA